MGLLDPLVVLCLIFLRTLHAVFYRCCNILHPHQQEPLCTIGWSLICKKVLCQTLTSLFPSTQSAFQQILVLSGHLPPPPSLYLQTNILHPNFLPIIFSQLFHLPAIFPLYFQTVGFPTVVGKWDCGWTVTPPTPPGQKQRPHQKNVPSWMSPSILPSTPPCPEGGTVSCYGPNISGCPAAGFPSVLISEPSVCLLLSKLCLQSYYHAYSIKEKVELGQCSYMEILIWEFHPVVETVPESQQDFLRDAERMGDSTCQLHGHSPHLLIFAGAAEPLSWYLISIVLFPVLIPLTSPF